MNWKSIFIKKNKLTYRVQENAGMAFDTEKEILYEMNGIASEIFNQIDGKKTVGEIVDYFLSKYIGDKAAITKDIYVQLHDFLKFWMIQLKHDFVQ